MSKLLLVKKALIRFHENVELDGYFYLNAQELVDELNELLDVNPAPLPTITVEEFKHA